MVIIANSYILNYVSGTVLNVLFRLINFIFRTQWIDIIISILQVKKLKQREVEQLEQYGNLLNEESRLKSVKHKS